MEVLRNGTSELTLVVGGVPQRQMAQLNMKAGIGATLCGFSVSVGSDAASRVWETACLRGGVGFPTPKWHMSGECFLAHFLSLPDFDSGAIDESHAMACRSEGSRASHNEKLDQKTHILKNRTDLLVNKLTTRTSLEKGQHFTTKAWAMTKEGPMFFVVNTIYFAATPTPR